MVEALPTFPYHPDPVATGAIKRSDRVCLCCGRARGWIYAGPAYAVDDIQEALCPWCIADGQAAKRFDASFVDDQCFSGAQISREAVTQVCERTPSYFGWQQEQWLSHCGDAAMFCGHATRAEAETMSEASREAFEDNIQGSLSRDWIAAHYVPGGNPAIYRFVCRACGLALFAYDCVLDLKDDGASFLEL